MQRALRCVERGKEWRCLVVLHEPDDEEIKRGEARKSDEERQSAERRRERTRTRRKVRTGYLLCARSSCESAQASER